MYQRRCLQYTALRKKAEDDSSILFVHSGCKQTNLNIGAKVKEKMASNQSSSPLVVGLIVVVMIVSMVSAVSLTYAFTHTSAAPSVTVTQTEVAVETETSTQTQTQVLQVPVTQTQTQILQVPGYPYPTRPSSGQPPTSTVQASEYGLVEPNGWMQTQNGCQIQLINMPAGYAGQYVTVYGTITYTNTNACPTNIIVSTVT